MNYIQVMYILHTLYSYLFSIVLQLNRSPTHQGSFFLFYICYQFKCRLQTCWGILENSDLMRISAQRDASACLDDTFTHQLRHVRHICAHMALLLCMWLMWLWAIAPAAWEHVGLNLTTMWTPHGSYLKYLSQTWGPLQILKAWSNFDSLWWTWAWTI